jgi:hypothetical protein
MEVVNTVVWVVTAGPVILTIVTASAILWAIYRRK